MAHVHEVSGAMIPDPEPLPDLSESASPEELAKLVQKQADLRREIKKAKAEKVVAGGRGRGKGSKGGGKGKNNSKQESEAVPEKVAVKGKRTRNSSATGEVANKEGAPPSKRTRAEQGNEKGFLTPFKAAPNVKVRNPHSPGQRRAMRESKSKSALSKLKHQKSCFQSLKTLPLLEDESKMNFGSNTIPPKLTHQKSNFKIIRGHGKEPTIYVYFGFIKPLFLAELALGWYCTLMC